MKNKITKNEIILFSFILLFAFLLRIYSLGSSPLWIDESTSSMASRMILEKGIPLFDSGLYYSSAYVLHYSMAFFMLFGQTDFFARFVSVIFGLLTVVLAYFIGKEYSKSGGIITSLFFAVFYLEVFFSRQSRYYQLFQLVFFASLYFLYKSKDKPFYLIPALIAFFIAIDTHLEALILAPVFILHILYYNRKQWFASIFPGILLVRKFLTAIRLSSGSSEITANYVGLYFSYLSNMIYLLILFIPGLIWSFFKKKRLTLLIVVPSVLTLLGVFSLQTFAFRYAYFFVFPLLLFSSLLFAFLYDRYGKLMLIPLLLLILVPSNLFFPHTYVNIITPISYNFNDYSSPETNFKIIPQNVISELKSDTILISYFSSNVEWYIRKPDFVIPFSLDGIGDDEISMSNPQGELVDRYSGAPILEEKPLGKYHLIADTFSISKLNSSQKEFLSTLTENCEMIYTSQDLKIYNCQNLNNQINGESL